MIRAAVTRLSRVQSSFSWFFFSLLGLGDDQGLVVLGRATY